MRSFAHILTTLIFTLTVCPFAGSLAQAQIVTAKPNSVSEVGIDEHLGEPLPLDITLTDSTGRLLALGELFDGKRPVILSFNYASCPMLCKLQLSGLIDSLGKLEWSAGDEFRVVSISIDPGETPEQSAVAKQKHLRMYQRAGSADGWSFLTGSPEAIRQAADAAGFRYQFVPSTKEYSHAAVIMICTPDGELSQYIYGVQFDSDTLRLSMAEAGNGEIGSSFDQLLLFCFRYNSATGKYAPVAWNLMRLAAGGTTLLLALILIPVWMRRKSQPKLVIETPGSLTTTAGGSA